MFESLVHSSVPLAHLHAGYSEGTRAGTIMLVFCLLLHPAYILYIHSGYAAVAHRVKIFGGSCLGAVDSMFRLRGIHLSPFGARAGVDVLLVRVGSREPKDKLSKQLSRTRAKSNHRKKMWFTIPPLTQADTRSFMSYFPFVRVPCPLPRVGGLATCFFQVGPPCLAGGDGHFRCAALGTWIGPMSSTGLATFRSELGLRRLEVPKRGLSPSWGSISSHSWVSYVEIP